MAHIILLEDEPVLLEELTEFLQTAGHSVTPCNTIASFRQAFSPKEHSVAIIDLGLPDGNGLDLIAELREQKHQLGIIVLTARSTTQDKISGLFGGADHYLPKTASLQELAATIATLDRRMSSSPVAPCWHLSSSPPRLIPPGFAPIALSAQDYTVLLALAAKGKTVSREAIVLALGENFFEYDQRRLDTQMRRLRRKVEEACGLQLPVTTLRGIGFHFYDEIEVVR
ncbi:MAG: response regulator transcription factor [Burkholderiaceae bacterium]